MTELPEEPLMTPCTAVGMRAFAIGMGAVAIGSDSIAIRCDCGLELNGRARPGQSEIEGRALFIDHAARCELARHRIQPSAG